MSERLDNPDRIGVALLGCGHMYHAPLWAAALADEPGVQFVGVWDPQPARAEALAAGHGTRAWADRAALLSRPDVAAVAICSENSLHAELIAAAARAGKHVYCEKPAAATLADCRRIERAVREAGVLYGQSFPKRHDPLHRRLAAMVADGAVGQVGLVRLRHGHAAALGAMAGYGGSWFCDPAANGGGSFLDEGVHAADLLAWLCGRPAAVVAQLMRLDADSRIDQAGVAVFRFPGGGLGEICSGSIFAAAGCTSEVYGRDGALLVTGTDGASRGVAGEPALLQWRRDWPERTWRRIEVAGDFGRPAYHQNGLRAFLRCVRGGAAPSPGLAEGVAAVEMILAAHEAARTGRRVALPLEEHEPYRADDLVAPAERARSSR